LLALDPGGRILAGDGEYEKTAFYIHSRIHLANAHAACVLHTHMPHATALTLLEDGRLEMVEQNALRFHDDIAYDDTYNGLVVDHSEGDRLARVLGAKRVMFLANHGVIVVGPSIAEAFDSLYYLERACRLQVLARMMGGKRRAVRPEVVDTARRMMREDAPAYARAHFSALKRILDREEPAYSR
jgi:ribulose-5-phosphate 4-epimerase/fuculose-1-phosphate aldolase